FTEITPNKCSRWHGITLSRKQGSISRVERQRVDGAGVEVVCFNGETCCPLFPGTQKVVRAFARGFNSAVFIGGSQAILRVCHVRAEVRRSGETDAVCCMSLDQSTFAAICSRASFAANESESYRSRNVELSEKTRRPASGHFSRPHI